VAAKAVIASYRANPGQEAELLRIIRRHIPVLRGLGLVTDRPPMILKAEDGVLLEIFEWVSDEAATHAHDSTEVQAIWGELGSVASYLTLSELAEAHQKFPHFEAANLDEKDG
jgi:hypothetical protein